MHPGGDLVLKAVSRTISSLLRAHDLFGRFGGEEFGILFYAPTRCEALGGAERVRRAVEAMDAPDCSPVPISIGLAAVEHDRSLDDTLTHADAALYAAKREGRNRCVTAD